MSLFETLRTAYAVRFFSVVLMLLYLVMLAPLWGGIILLRLFVSRGDLVTTLVGFTILFSALAAGWFSRITAHHMAIDGQPFPLAFKSTFYPVAMKLSFLPVVGGYFERILAGKKPNPFRQEPE
jgi:hypothetical protein